jgi:beta-N-acetylhexosaminidase
MILSFDGASAPEYVTRALREGRVAGVILFRDNVASPQQLRELTGSLQRAAGGSALVMTDQEGGPVRILPFAPPDEGSSAQSTGAEAHQQASAAARALRRNGVNVNLAPVADVPSVAGAALAGRAYSGDAATVASRVRAAVTAHRRGRVGATAKHFPGLGAAVDNTDDAPVTIPGPTEQDLTPFRAAIAAGSQLVMTSHALYPDIDAARIASQSPAILTGLLRERLGFRGVVVTDSMEAEAVLDRSGVPRAAERSLLAGADLLLLTGSGSFRPVSQRLNAVAARSPMVRARLRQSALRVVALKRELGLAVPPAIRQPG